MYSSQDIVRIVNENLIDIEDKLHGRDGIDVFTNGDCGLVPYAYGWTGLDVVPLRAQALTQYGEDIKVQRHFMSIVDNKKARLLYDKIRSMSPRALPKKRREKLVNADRVKSLFVNSVYDINSKNGQPTDTSDMQAFHFTSWLACVEASCGYSCVKAKPEEIETQEQEDALFAKEQILRNATKDELKKRLLKHGMFKMTRNAETGLYLPNSI